MENICHLKRSVEWNEPHEKESSRSFGSCCIWHGIYMSPSIDGFAWPYKLKPQLYSFPSLLLSANPCLCPKEISSIPEAITLGIM